MMTANLPLPSLELIHQYVTALSQGDDAAMQVLRAPNFILDWVHGDAFADQPMSRERTNLFWPAWFGGFSEFDFEVSRTIAAEEVVVIQWIFTGTQDGPLGTPVFDPPKEPSGKTIRLRGVSVFDIEAELIVKETMYIDQATLWVELGVTP